MAFVKQKVEQSKILVMWLTLEDCYIGILEDWNIAIEIQWNLTFGIVFSGFQLISVYQSNSKQVSAGHT